MSATGNSRACFKSLNQNQKYALIYQGLALDGNKPTPQQIENETTVTDAEIQVGMEWFAEDQKCSALSIQELSNLDFRIGTKVAGWQTEITDIFDDAISNHPTYGHINTRINRLTDVKTNDLRHWLNSEVNRRQALEDQKANQNQAIAVEVGFAVLTSVILALQSKENAIEQSQSAYSSRQPNYKPRPVGITHCTLQQAPRYSLAMNPSPPVVVCNQSPI